MISLHGFVDGKRLHENGCWTKKHCTDNGMILESAILSDLGNWRIRNDLFQYHLAEELYE